MLAPWKKSYEKPSECILKKQRHHFANKGSSSQSYGFPSGHVVISSDIKLRAEELMVLNCGAGEGS